MENLLTNKRKLFKDKENKAEKLLVSEIKKRGGLCWKFVSPGNAGVPDRFVAYRGRVCFVELKNEVGFSSELQKSRARELDRHGICCYTLKGENGVKEWATRWLDAI